MSTEAILTILQKLLALALTEPGQAALGKMFLDKGITPGSLDSVILSLPRPKPPVPAE